MIGQSLGLNTKPVNVLSYFVLSYKLRKKPFHMYCIIRTHDVLFLSILFVTLFAQRTDVKTFVNTRQVYTRQVVVIIIAFPSFFLFIQTEDDKREREKMEKKKKKEKGDRAHHFSTREPARFRNSTLFPDIWKSLIAPWSCGLVLSHRCHDH